MTREESPQQTSGSTHHVRPDPAASVKVLSCASCASPVASTAAKCFTCGSPVTGKEFQYIAQQKGGPDIQGLLKWWCIWSLGIFALGGFSFEVAPTLAIIAVSIVYLLRVFRAY